MLKIIENEAKTKDEALLKCLEEANANEKEVYQDVEELTSGLFKKNKYKVKIITKSSVKDFVKEYIEELSKKMNILIKSEIKETEQGINVLLISDNSSILIGKEGKNLNSFQILLRQAISSKGKFDIKINLDISNYKENKTNNLKREIKNIAREVRKTKVEVKLDSMNSYERRIVHSIIGEYEDLETESLGEEPNRYVVIKFKED